MAPYPKTFPPRDPNARTGPPGHVQSAQKKPKKCTRLALVETKVWPIHQCQSSSAIFAVDQWTVSHQSCASCVAETILYHSKELSIASVPMLRAFVVLSKTLNLARTCEELNATRQTVRRHIHELETIKGGSLFKVESRQYQLTPFGRASIAEAEFILRQIEKWSCQSKMNKASSEWLESNRYVDQDGREFLSQQHPVSKIATNGLPIMKSVVAAWGASQTQIEHEAMAKVRPYLVLFRKVPSGWVFAEVGEKSGYARWFGWTWSKSAIGKLMQEDNAGDDFNEFIAGAYARIYGEGGVRLDHIFAHLPKAETDEVVPVSFQRLLLGCVFPDGTPGLGLLGLITKQVEIDALDDQFLSHVPEDLVMDFEI
ncbi:LysR family transcriptional regulator [Aestuariicoccus sp. MJ-SS9]|uniref:helix-turn-helix domain-containing protein n=1 Tax=Aestuariicoccus sp. MJ-SS9 TaxID=3079855 RepID=UPI00290F9455|nr:LysR family transcriptional regulator [Aestuariicoccus sp. MJ-SS9]MDU8911326.1 LysR family transcriptional regulator [Aestuariicoccus sp. MJ-SS9]